MENYTAGDAACDIAGQLSGDEMVKEFDVLVVLTILKVLVTFYQCWRDHAELARIVQAPDWVQTRRLRRAVRKGLRQAGGQRDVDEYVDAFLAYGKVVTPDRLAGVVASL